MSINIDYVLLISNSPSNWEEINFTVEINKYFKTEEPLVKQI